MKRILACLLIAISACGEYVPQEPRVRVEYCPKGWEIVTEAYGGFSSGEKSWCEFENLKTDVQWKMVPESELDR